jgi:hypothetical protein
MFGWFRQHPRDGTNAEDQFAERSSSAMSVDGEIQHILHQACQQQALMEEFSLLERRWMQAWYARSTC